MRVCHLLKTSRRIQNKYPLIAVLGDKELAILRGAKQVCTVNSSVTQMDCDGLVVTCRLPPTRVMSSNPYCYRISIVCIFLDALLEKDPCVRRS
ncbi:hypothetical protein AVEN_158510-1 [Araneus ventricosus]|uniref:Uncharacterized protein n=1 Tax=Araneus ventricosus TaxID=182803 RepID=A0A4Y2JIS5_ARAVE|nr:hypothetical protein AVEN_158510-1 [Araneus ventricosus]